MYTNAGENRIGFPYKCSSFTSIAESTKMSFQHKNTYAHDNDSMFSYHNSSQCDNVDSGVYSENWGCSNSSQNTNESLLDISEFVDNGPKPTLGLLNSTLDTDWDNSDLDVTSSTTREDDTSVDMSRAVRHTVFITHLQQCYDCINGKECPIVGELEGDVSSFFELEEFNHPNKEIQIEDDDKSHLRTLQRCTSYLSVTSDNVDFMDKPMCRRVPVTVKITKAKKKSISDKIKQLRSYIGRKNRGKDITAVCNNGFKTLAVL